MTNANLAKTNAIVYTGASTRGQLEKAWYAIQSAQLSGRIGKCTEEEDYILLVPAKKHADQFEQAVAKVRAALAA
jgi:hypothetical protein